MYRLGFTETTLLFFFYLDKLSINNEHYIKDQHKYINWLYTTSGMYDKTVTGTYFNFDADMIKQTRLYKRYFTNLLTILKNTKYTIQLCFQKFNDKLLSYKEDFLKHINYYTKTIIYKDIFSFMENKDILIINNLGPLMKQQYESNNMKYISPNYRESIKSVQYLENGYTFFNNGPHENILKTIKSLYKKIKNYQFDGAIISAGAYSCFLANYIETELNKEVFIIGGTLPLYFGIKTTRIQNHNSKDINEYFIDVPEEMKPHDYMKIENGCYW